MRITSRPLSVVVGTVVIAAAVTVSASASASTDSVSSGATKPTSSPSATTATAATPELAQLLQFSREEERMARDLYAALAAVHDGATPMSRITLSEDRHFDAVGTLLTTYRVADPSAGRAAGSYAFPELQALYDGWLAKGSASVNAAYQVGVELEKRDIADLEKSLLATTQADVKRVLGNLLNGSQQHLSAYQNASSGTTTGMGQGQGRRGGTGQSGRPGMGPRSGQAVGGQSGAGRGAMAGRCLANS